MQMPMPAGTPMRLPAQVAGQLSRLQGQMMAARPEIENAYAMHWLAMRETGGVPAFQQMTQNMLWGLYGKTALSGLLRYALSGRGTPAVMGGIIDQMNLIQQSYNQATNAMRTFMDQPEARDFPAVPMMVRAFVPMDRVYQNVQQPFHAVTTGLSWVPGGPMPMVGFRAAYFGEVPTGMETGVQTLPPANGDEESPEGKQA